MPLELADRIDHQQSAARLCDAADIDELRRSLVVDRRIRNHQLACQRKILHHDGFLQQEPRGNDRRRGHDAVENPRCQPFQSCRQASEQRTQQGGYPVFVLHLTRHVLVHVVDHALPEQLENDADRDQFRIVKMADVARRASLSARQGSSSILSSRLRGAGRPTQRTPSTNSGCGFCATRVTS